MSVLTALAIFCVVVWLCVKGSIWLLKHTPLWVVVAVGILFMPMIPFLICAWVFLRYVEPRTQ
jgi:hypothetical protein